MENLVSQPTVTSLFDKHERKYRGYISRF